MLSVFPSFLTWSELSPTILRITLAVVLIYWTYKTLRGQTQHDDKFSQNKIVAIIEGLCGLLLFVGLWTQLAALIVIIDLVVKIAQKIGKKQFLNNGVNYYLILLIIAISVLITGAGFLAFDLGPL
jgi:uncharacterized membrane protein YphA (DoxX/SURF4 family)